MMYKVLIVDDSILVRRIVTDIVKKTSKNVICYEASNGKEALDLIEREHPDLVILDVEMPVMDGFSTLVEIKKRNYPVHVLMLSVLTQHGASVSAHALELGAAGVLPKPAPQNGIRLSDLGTMLGEKIEGFLQTHVSPPSPVIEHRQIPEILLTKKYQVLVLACSTGGPQALNSVISELPADFSVPILIVQHMPPVFTTAFAERLNQNARIQVVEAKEGDLLVPGKAFLAPGDVHLLLERTARGVEVRLNAGEKRNANRPSIDVTLESVVAVFGGHAVAVIMTGMGWDGAQGMKLLHDAGGMTVAQNEETSVIFGMNRRAIEIGAIQKIVPLYRIVEEILPFFDQKG